MKAKNLPTKEVSNMRGIIRFIARKKMSHLGESIHNEKYRVFAILGARQTENKVHTYVFPWNMRNWQRHIETMRKGFGLSL